MHETKGDKKSLKEKDNFFFFKVPNLGKTRINFFLFFLPSFFKKTKSFSYHLF